MPSMRISGTRKKTPRTSQVGRRRGTVRLALEEEGIARRSYTVPAGGVSLDEANLKKLEQYFTERPDLGVASVYLFGSHAEGRAHRESDVDVGILLLWERHPTQDDRFDMRVQLGSELIAVLHHNEV